MILSSVRGPSLAFHSASHSTSSCPPLLQLLHGITESTPYIPSTHSSTFSGLISGCRSFFIRYWMNVCCKVWGSAHDLSCTQNRKTGAFRGTITGETKTSLYHTSLHVWVSLRCPRMNIPVRNVIKSEPVLAYFSPIRTADKPQQQHRFVNLRRPFVQAECPWRLDADPVERQLISAFESK